jgi:hypothetical protein
LVPLPDDLAKLQLSLLHLLGLGSHLLRADEASARADAASSRTAAASDFSSS